MLFGLLLTSTVVATPSTPEIEAGIESYIESFNNYVGSFQDTFQNVISVITYLLAIFAIVYAFLYFERKTKKYTRKQISFLKKNKKYIPGVFVELNESKEILRYFLYGKKWKSRLIKGYNFIYNNSYGDILKEANTETNMQFKIGRKASLDEIEHAIENALNYHSRFHSQQISLKEAYKDSQPLFEITYYPYKDALEKLQNYTLAANRNYIILTGSAGNGKTNLLCSITELALKLNKPIIFLNSRDIHSDIIDHILDSLNIPDILKKWKKQYFWLINLKFRILRKQLFIVIDAINENDHTGYGARINSFINSMKKYDRVKLVVSCRSEYYEERFKKNLSEEVNQTHFTLDIKDEKYPEAAIDRVIERYKEYFHYSGVISESVKYVLSQHLLLLRIFFEINQNKNVNALSIRKHELFAAYISQIRNTTSPNIEKIINSIVDTMLANMCFDHIPLNKLQDFSEEEVLKAFDETVLLNKKLILHSGTIAETSREVAYFVFDELRDYCIARRIMQSHVLENGIDYNGIIADIERIRNLQASCEEGVLHYSYVFFKTASELPVELRRSCCNRILEFYQIETNVNQYQRNYLRDEFSNYGLKIIFTTGLPLEEFEKTFIRNCLRDPNCKDACALFRIMLSGTKVGLDNNLDMYFDILWSLHDEHSIIAALESTGDSYFPGYQDLSDVLVRMHRQLRSPHPERAQQIQKIAVLFMFVFQTDEREDCAEFNEYFCSLHDHEIIFEEMQQQFFDACGMEE